MIPHLQEKLISSFTELAQWMLHPDDELDRIQHAAQNHNAWFTPEMVKKAFESIAKSLTKNNLEKWLQPYTFATESKNIGLVLAGNIPLVGFHDILCVLMAGHRVQIKVSSNDALLSQVIVNKLIEIDSIFTEKIQFVERLQGFDAVIATGSNNTSRYFEYYFQNVPHIIRKNRNSVAVISGAESNEELHLLGADIFDYYGLGCRNVSKLMLPQNYEIKTFFEAIESYQPIIHHHKYNNNYDYNKSIYLVNSIKHYDNGFLLLTENENIASPLAVLYTEGYENIPSLTQKLEAQKEQLQCVVTHLDLALEYPTVDFGQSQFPQLWDYADHVDTMAFLTELSSPTKSGT